MTERVRKSRVAGKAAKKRREKQNKNKQRSKKSKKSRKAEKLDGIPKRKGNKVGPIKKDPLKDSSPIYIHICIYFFLLVYL